MSGPTLRTERLVLRPWRESDREPLAAMCADPAVMRHFPSLLSADESSALFERLQSHFDSHGFGFWAVEAPGVAPFIGLVGLAYPSFQAPFTPCVEVGWRLASAHWKRGFAVEAALASLAFGFERLALQDIVSFTVPENERSRRVMERLGMRHESEHDFDHPKLPQGHPLRRHVFYRLSADEWRRQRRA